MCTFNFDSKISTPLLLEVGKKAIRWADASLSLVDSAEG
jgi:hypothetical protein